VPPADDDLPMHGSLIGYAPRTPHVDLSRAGQGWMRFWTGVHRKREPVYAVRIPRFTDIPPT
jgi:hypothetical protein